MCVEEAAKLTVCMHELLSVSIVSVVTIVLSAVFKLNDCIPPQNGQCSEKYRIVHHGSAQLYTEYGKPCMQTAPACP